jgi:hypothetical protein
MRPKIVIDEHLEFLDFIRESGNLNMLDVKVRELLMNRYEIEWLEAKEIHLYWVSSFGKENR